MSAGEPTITDSGGASRIFGIALTAGPCVGLLEVLPHLSERGSEPVAELIFPVASTMTLVALCQALAIACLIWPARRLWGWAPALTAERFALGSTVFVGAILVSERALVPRSSADLAYAVLALALALGLTALVHLVSPLSTTRLGPLGPRLAAFGRACPLLLLELAAFARLARDLDRAIGWEAGGAALALFGVLAGTLRALAAIPPRFVAPAHLLGLVALLAFSWVQYHPALPEPLAVDPAPPIETVIVISIDTIRARDLSLYGGRPGTSPHLDALGADAVVFEKAIAGAPLTLGGLGSVMTGVSAAIHRAFKTGIGIPVELETLAEQMQAAGYLTAAIGQNSSMFARWGLGQGFHHYDIYPRRRWTSIGTRQVGRLFPSILLESAEADDVTNLGLRFLASKPQGPLFLWLHYVDPHLPYTPPPAYVENLPPQAPIRKLEDAFRLVRLGVDELSEEERAWMKELYLGEIRFADAEVGRLITSLKQSGRYDDALIVLVGDHGEEFFEHGGFEHGQSVRDVVLHVPLLVKLPGGRFTGRVGRPVPTQAVMATVLDLAERPAPPGPGVAPSLVGLFDPSREEPAFEPILSSGLMYFEDRLALRWTDVKYVRYLASGRDVVFDLVADPGEIHPIPGDDWPGIERLRKEFGRQMEKAEAVRRELGLAP